MRHAIPLVLLAALLAACGFPSASLDEPSICKTLSDQVVPPSGRLTTLSLPLSLDLRPTLAKLGVKSGHAQVSSLSLHAVDGVSDLGFLTSTRVTLAQGAGDGGAVDLVDFEAAAAPARITAAGTDADLFPAALEGPLELELSIAGQLPNNVWHADVSLCVALQAELGD